MEFLLFVERLLPPLVVTLSEELGGNSSYLKNIIFEIF